MPACVHGDMIISVSTMDGANTPEMKMATAFVKCMSIRWKGSGRSCGVGCARIRGISQEKLPLYLGFFEFVHNIRQLGKALLHALIGLLSHIRPWNPI